MPTLFQAVCFTLGISGKYDIASTLRRIVSQKQGSAIQCDKDYVRGRYWQHSSAKGDGYLFAGKSPGRQSGREKG